MYMNSNHICVLVYNKLYMYVHVHVYIYVVVCSPTPIVWVMFAQ